MQLLIEDAYEFQPSIVEVINESTGQKEKNYFLEGVFSTPDKKNRNGRIYPRKVWERLSMSGKKKLRLIRSKH